MNFNIAEITTEGRIGKINLQIDNNNFSWEWEFGGDGVLVAISIPDRNEWENIFGNCKNRDETLMRIAKNICELKCKNGKIEITDDEILILE